MKPRLIAIAVAALLALTVQPAIAEKVAGYNHIDVPPQTDVLLGVPFNNNMEGEFTVDTVTLNGVTVTDTLVADAFDALYYVRLLTGDGAGLWSTISDNGVNDISFANPDVLGFVSAGDTFRVYRHHTLRSVFPPGMFGKSYTNGNTVLFYANDTHNMRQNKSAVKICAFAGGNWVGQGCNTDAGTILNPETQFILRNGSGLPLEFISLGGAPDHPVSALVAPNGDLDMSTGYPVPIVLNDSGLGSQLRQVLFYSNLATGINKSAVKIAAYINGNWVGNDVTGLELLNPSQAFAYRLPVSEAGTKVTIEKPY